MTDPSRKHLAIAAVAVALLAGWSILRWTAGPNPVRFAAEGSLVCGACGGKFVVDSQAMRQRSESLRYPDHADRRSPPATCPGCGVKHVTMEAVVCGECNRLFTPALDKPRNVAADEIARRCPGQPHHAR